MRATPRRPVAEKRTYRIEIERAPEKAIARQSPNVSRRLREAIDRLADDPRPRNCTKLQGQSQAHYRIRVGDWRIIYVINDDRLLVLIVDAGPRGGVYGNY